MINTLIYTNKGLILKYQNRIFIHIKYFRKIKINEIKKVSIINKYIELKKLDYEIIDKKLNFYWEKNWAYKIIYPNAIDYWKKWSISFGYSEICVDWCENFEALSIIAINEKKKLKITYNKKDSILLANWLWHIKNFFNDEKIESKIIINNKTIENEIELFIEIVNNDLIIISGDFDCFFPEIEFNDKPIVFIKEN